MPISTSKIIFSKITSVFLKGSRKVLRLGRMLQQLWLCHLLGKVVMIISSDICATHKNIETVTMMTIIRIMILFVMMVREGTKSQKLGHLFTHCHHFKYKELPIAIIIILIIKLIILMIFSAAWTIWPQLAQHWRGRWSRKPRSCSSGLSWPLNDSEACDDDNGLNKWGNKIKVLTIWSQTVS